MSINFSASKKAWDDHVFPNFKKSLIRTPVTKTLDNISGDETLTDGTADSTYEGILYRKEDAWSQENIGLFQGADAVLLVKTTQTLNKDDKITFDSEVYRVEKVVSRYYDDVKFYIVGQLFLIE